jgi:hypothetical protein
VSALQKDVDYLLIAKSVMHLSHSGIRRYCALFSRVARSLVVLTEDSDPRPLGGESMSEICEIGAQGALAVVGVDY